MKKLIVAASLGVIVGVASLAVAAPEDWPQTSPLSEYIGFGHNMDLEIATFEAEQAERELLVVECMRKAGFSYRPVTALLFVPEAVGDVPGWGIAAGFLDSTEPGDAPQIPTNPNVVAVSRMSDTEKSRYYEALYGPDPFNESRDQASEEMGCSSQSYAQVPSLQRGLLDLRAAYDAEVRDTVSRSAAVLSGERIWRDCMSSENFSFRTRAEMLADIDGRLAELVSVGQSPDAATLTSIGELEEKMATADDLCSADLRRALLEETIRAERAFIDRYTAELEPFRVEAWN